MENNYPDVCAIAHFHSIQESNKQYVTEFSYVDCLGRILLYRVVLPKHVRNRIFEKHITILDSQSIPNVKDIHLKDLQDELYYEIRPRLLYLNQNFKIGISKEDQRRFFDYIYCPTVEIVHDCEEYNPSLWFIRCNNHLRYPTLNCSLAYTLRMLSETSWWEKAVGELQSEGYIQMHHIDLDVDFRAI